MFPLDSSIDILFFNVFTTYVFSLWNSRWEDGPGLLASLTTGTTDGRPWPGKIRDRKFRPAQLLSSPFRGTAFNPGWFFTSYYPWSKVKAILHSAEERHWKSAFGLGLRPKVLRNP